MITSNNITLAVRYLDQGEVIAVATETVYGLAAVAHSKSAVAKVFRLKNRPPDKHLAYQFADLAMVEKHALVGENARKVLLRFTPGPLTLVLPKRATSNLVTQDILQDTIGVRIPDHRLMLALLQKMAVPLVVTSANPSNLPAATSSREVRTWFKDKIPMLLSDTQEHCSTVPSTVVDMSGETPVLLRAGNITLEQIGSLLAENN